jgi:outer membrane lipoprotein-sorting protein
MPSRTKNFVRALAAVFASAALSSAALSQSTAPAVKKAEDEYMNIQVLKGVPADQVIPAMQFISSALGADCEFCHVKGSFEKDDLEPKKTARKMITMMNSINTANFNGRKQVTCFTCHHGSQEALATPIVPDVEPPMREEPAKPAAMPAASAVLDKYLAASGGAAAVNKVTSRVQKGTMGSFGGRSSPVEVYSKAPNKRATYATMGQGQNITAFDGTNGWLGNPGRPPRDMTPVEAAAFKLDAELRFPLTVKTLFKSFDVSPADKIGTHDVVLLSARNEGQPPVRLYFDTQTGLLVRQVRYVETPLGRNPTQIDYDDYRDSDGMKIPYKWTVARPQGRFTIQVAEVQNNVAVDDSKFAKPAVPPAPAPK